MFEEALLTAVARLEAARDKAYLQQFVLIGGLAVSRWAVPRATGDIDFAVALGSVPIERLADYLGGTLRVGDISDPLVAAISFAVAPENAAVPVQLAQFPAGWEKVVFHELSFETVAGCSVPIIDWKGLILIKLYAGSPLDLDDALKILSVVKPSEVDRQYLLKKASALRVSRRLARVFGSLAGRQGG